MRICCFHRDPNSKKLNEERNKRKPIRSMARVALVALIRFFSFHDEERVADICKVTIEQQNSKREEELHEMQGSL